MGSLRHVEHDASSPSKGSLSRLMDKIRNERGLDLAQYRPRYVERRLAVRMNALDIPTYGQYATYLDRHEDEYAKMLDALTINVTQFFRDPSVYALVRSKVAPALLRLKQARKQRLVRIWSAGCATGEEPYSLAMLFLDVIEQQQAHDIVMTVIGTDIDKQALAFAKRARYPARELPNIPHADRVRYVSSDAEGFDLAPDVLKVVRFQHLNLFDDTPIHGVDVIFCRNVFIYFNREEQERLVEIFKKSLVRGGFLVLGRSERLSPALASDLELVSSRERIYRKPTGML